MKILDFLKLSNEEVREYILPKFPDLIEKCGPGKYNRNVKKVLGISDSSSGRRVLKGRCKRVGNVHFENRGPSGYRLIFGYYLGMTYLTTFTLHLSAGDCSLRRIDYHDRIIKRQGSRRVKDFSGHISVRIIHPETMEELYELLKKGGDIRCES